MATPTLTDPNAPPKSDMDNLYDEKTKNLAQYKAGLAAQTAAAKGAEGQINEAEQGALGAVRAKSGQALARDMSRGGGGSTAGLRQAALSRGAQEGSVMSEYAGQRLAAQQAAAKAQTEEASKLQELTQQEAEVGTRVEDAITKAKKILEGKSSLFSTESDKDAAAAEIQSMIDYETDPKVKAELQRFKDNIHSYDTDSFDTEDVTEFFN